MRIKLAKSLPVFFLLFANLVAGALISAPADNLIARRFEAAPGGQLVVRADRGSIEVEAGEPNRVSVEITPEGWSLEELQEVFEIRFEQSGDQVVVEIQSRKAGLNWLKSRGRKGLTIRALVPSEFDVDLKTAGGGISVGDLRGEVRGATSGGGLRFGDIEGSIWGRTSGGEIQVSRCDGEVNVHTSGGGISLGDVGGSVEAVTSGGPISLQRASGPVVVRTSGGDIQIEEVTGSIQASTSGGSIEAALTEQPSGDSLLSTSGGSIRVRLAPGLSLDIDATTGSGEVQTDLGISARGENRRGKLQGALNGGGPALVLKTSGGGIHIR